MFLKQLPQILLLDTFLLLNEPRGFQNILTYSDLDNSIYYLVAMSWES